MQSSSTVEIARSQGTCSSSSSSSSSSSVHCIQTSSGEIEISSTLSSSSSFENNTFPQPSTSTTLSTLECDTTSSSNEPCPSTSASLANRLVNKSDHCDDPTPGPSTSAADFDLEVFDSGSSCSLEDCWGLGSESLEKAQSEKESKCKEIPESLSASRKSKKPATVVSNESTSLPSTSSTSSTPRLTEAYDDEEEDETSAVVIVGQNVLLRDPPESACPSETEEAGSDRDDEVDEEEEEEGLIPPTVDLKQSSSSENCHLPPTECQNPKEAVESWRRKSRSNTSKMDSSAGASSSSGDQFDNIDEIVNDHDNFGTDENEDSMDSNMGAMENGAICDEKGLGKREDFGNYVFPPVKRKSGILEADEDDEGSNIKKQCVIAPDQTIEIVADMIHDIAGSGDAFVYAPTAVEKDVIVETSEFITSEQEISENNTHGCANLPERKLIPDKDNPPREMLDWLSTFGRWSNAEKLLAIDQLISSCQPSQVRHMMAVIEPQFQRDFISLLPKELALIVLSFLSPRDLLRAAQTCRYWRILCEDNLLWREKCREAGLEDTREAIMKARSSRKLHSHFPYSPWKLSFMRQHNIEMNWRQRDTSRQMKILKGHDDHVITCLQFSNNRIVSGSDDNTLKVWSAVTGKCLRTLVGHTGGVWSSQMEDNTIVSGSTDRTLKVWNADTGACIHTLYGHTSTVRCMHLHKKRVVSGSRDATLRMWDIVTGECLHVLVGHVAAVRCVQYDGRLVVSGAYDYIVKVWNPEREECLHTLSGHTNRVYSLQFDGVHVVSGSLDTSIRVWDVESGACKHALMGHQSLTSGMELRNNILVSGNADSTVKVWDITTGQCLQTLSGPNKHQSAVTCLQFNSKFVITSSDDGTVKLWDVKTGEFIRDLVALESGGSGGVVWRIRANATKLVCAVGSRNGTEETKLLVLDFDVDK